MTLLHFYLGCAVLGGALLVLRTLMLLAGFGGDATDGPDFDPGNYGFQRLTPLIESCPKYFEIEKRKVENSHVKHVFVRLK